MAGGSWEGKALTKVFGVIPPSGLWCTGQGSGGGVHILESTPGEKIQGITITKNIS